MSSDILDDRGQVEVFPVWPVGLSVALVLAAYIGFIVYQRLRVDVVSDTTLCAGRCGFWLPPSEVAGLLAIVVILLVVGVGVFGRAVMIAGFSSRSDDD
jgi:hypothetical protein